MSPHVPIDEQHPGAPQQSVPPSVFHGVGAFVAQAGSFPPDSPGARALARAIERVGEGWVAVQFGDPKTHDRNVEQLIDRAWADRFRRDVGAAVLGWYRVNQIAGDRSVAYANELSETLELDGWVFNVEDDPEVAQIPKLAAGYRAAGDLAFITMGKQPRVDVHAIASANGHLFAECFRESPLSDTNVAECHRFWTDSGLAERRFHPTLPDPTFGLPVDHKSELAYAKRLGVEGVAVYVGENTPPTLFDLIEAP